MEIWPKDPYLRFFRWVQIRFLFSIVIIIASLTIVEFKKLFEAAVFFAVVILVLMLIMRYKSKRFGIVAFCVLEILNLISGPGGFNIPLTIVTIFLGYKAYKSLK